MRNKILKFPDGFLWGAATSAYQVEGGIEGSDWAVSGKVPRAGASCDHYRRYEEDFQIAKYLHHNAHRLSLEWSRIESLQGKFDNREIEHYHRVLSRLKAGRLQTFVTLHHFTNPLWFAEKGGWLDGSAVRDFSNYVSKICQALGHLIDFWITVNEPLLYAGMAYGRGQWPPFEKNYREAWRVYGNMLAAHSRAYDIIHDYYPEARVGFAQNIADNAGLVSGVVNNFLEIEYPYGRTKNDFLGVNHYFYRKPMFSLRARRIGATDWPVFPIYPKALYHVLGRLRSYRLPIYITENGLPDAKDLKRERYIRSYLSEVYRAIAAGADVRGYLHWSLLDNFEWAEGYKYRFGLVAVDFKTQKRTIRESAFAYSHICQDNGLELT